MSITLEDAKAALHYDPDTGIFTWRARTGPRAKIGAIAGNAHNGYVRITLHGRAYMAHVLAWLIITGEWPTYEVDHIDCDRANNRWANLREATRPQNMRNRPVRKDNPLGVTGIYRDGGKYVAKISSNGEQIYLGRFDTVEAAASARAWAANDIHGEFARTT